MPIFSLFNPYLEKLADPEAENSHPPQQDELSEEKNNDNDKNAGDTGEERNEETQHLDELSILIFFWIFLPIFEKFQILQWEKTLINLRKWTKGQFT